MTDTVERPFQGFPRPGHANGASGPWPAGPNGSNAPGDLLVAGGAPVRTMGWPPSGIVSGCREMLARIGPETSALGVTSPGRNCGRTSIALTSALVLARDYGRRTVLVELDLERPSLSRWLGIQPSPGVAEVLRKEADVGETVQVVDERLGVIVAGNLAGPPGPVASAMVASGLVNHLRGRADSVVADLPPLLVSESAGRLAGTCEGVLMVVRSSATALGDVRRAVQELREPPPVVLNDFVSSVPTWMGRLTGS